MDLRGKEEGERGVGMREEEKGAWEGALQDQRERKWWWARHVRAPPKKIDCWKEKLRAKVKSADMLM